MRLTFERSALFFRGGAMRLTFERSALFFREAPCVSHFNAAPFFSGGAMRLTFERSALFFGRRHHMLNHGRVLALTVVSKIQGRANTRARHHF